MQALTAQEIQRLRTLLHQYSLDEYEALILREAHPAISLFVDPVVERDQRISMADYPVGTSRFGGLPDLPVGTEWPAGNNEPLTFILQLALSSLPAMPGNPLPAKGMLWVFHGGADTQDELTARMIWRDCEPSQCIRREPGSTADALDFREYDPFAIDAVLGTDFPPTDQHDDRPNLGVPLPENYFDFLARARDPDFDRREASGYPYAWQQIGQLFGVTSNDLQQEVRSHWRRLLSLNSNPLTDFSTLNDTAPLHYMIEERPAPWTIFEPVFIRSAI